MASYRKVMLAETMTVGWAEMAVVLVWGQVGKEGMTPPDLVPQLAQVETRQAWGSPSCVSLPFFLFRTLISSCMDYF